MLVNSLSRVSGDFEMSKNTLTQEQLKTHLLYEPTTGNFIWIDYPGGKRKYKGTIAGSLDLTNGYIHITLLGISYRAHRLAYLYMTGNFPPEGYIPEHINTDKADNSWNNLRLATALQNNYNASKSIRNTSGHKGISFDRKSKQWRVDINCNKVRYRYGYTTLEEAIVAVRLLREELHREFANHG